MTKELEEASASQTSLMTKGSDEATASQTLLMKESVEAWAAQTLMVKESEEASASRVDQAHATPQHASQERAVHAAGPSGTRYQSARHHHHRRTPRQNAPFTDHDGYATARAQKCKRERICQ